MDRTTGWIPTILAVAFVLLMIAGSTFYSSQNRFNAAQSYRLTADVVANGRHYVVSQTYNYNCARRIPGSGANIIVGTACELYGRAMHVDLGARGSLFILMNGWTPDHTGFSGADIWVHGLLYQARRNPSIPPALIPVMVRFGDLADPRTVQVVDPAHLDRSFGPGVSLGSMTIDFGATRPPPDDIHAALPWLKGFRGGRLSRTPGTLANKLHGFDFEWPPAQ